jgi:hypothetical protein
MKVSLTWVLQTIFGGNKTCYQPLHPFHSFPVMDKFLQSVGPCYCRVKMDKVHFYGLNQFRKSPLIPIFPILAGWLPKLNPSDASWFWKTQATSHSSHRDCLCSSPWRAACITSSPPFEGTNGVGRCGTGPKSATLENASLQKSGTQMIHVWNIESTVTKICHKTRKNTSLHISAKKIEYTVHINDCKS